MRPQTTDPQHSFGHSKVTVVEYVLHCLTTRQSILNDIVLVTFVGAHPVLPDGVSALVIRDSDMISVTGLTLNLSGRNGTL